MAADVPDDGGNLAAILTKSQRIAELERKVKELEQQIEIVGDLLGKPNSTVGTITTSGGLPKDVNIPTVWAYPSKTDIPLRELRPEPPKLDNYGLGG